MPLRQTKHKPQRNLPKMWLMTDPRLGDQLLKSIQGLPAGSGVIFRHYNLEADERRRLFRTIARICRKRGHCLLLAGSEREAIRWKADGVHNRTGRTISRRLLHSAPVHNLREMRVSMRLNADLIILSPIFTTSSHPGERALGLYRFAHLASTARNSVVIALGGMNKRIAQNFDRRRIHGWAAIDAFKL